MSDLEQQNAEFQSELLQLQETLSDRAIESEGQLDDHTLPPSDPIAAKAPDAEAQLEIESLPPPDPIPAESPAESPDAGAQPETLLPATAPHDTLDASGMGLRDTVILLRKMLRLVEAAILVQARSRLESVSVESIQLDSEDAFTIALANRLDLMNGRAALVDSWRLIQVNADALQSVLNVTADGDVRTARNNPLSFRAPTATVQLGLQFDAPLTRLIERNNYRESLINYQQSRRDYIQSEDAVHLGLRVLLRQIDQLRTNLETQRRAVAIAIRRVDLTRAALDQPVAPPRPGQRAAQFGPTAAINLLSAQSALRDTQNAFMGVWLNYYAAKMRLDRELGVMVLDAEGQWIEIPSADSMGGEVGGFGPQMEELPPPLPAGLLEAVDHLPEGFTLEVAVDSVESVEPLVENSSMIE
jgi:hypothetical protein